MALIIKSLDKLVRLTKLEIDKKNNTLIIVDSTEEYRLHVKLGFAIDQVPEIYLNSTKTEEVLLFENDLFSQSTVLSFRVRERVKKRGELGHFFMIRSIFDEENNILNQVDRSQKESFSIYAFKTAINLLLPEEDFLSVHQTDKSDFNIEDFYNLNLISLCIPFIYSEEVYNWDFHLFYLIPLHQYGFKLYNSEQNNQSTQIISKFTSNNFNNLSDRTGTGLKILRLEKASETIRDDEYFFKLLKEIQNTKLNFLTKFHMLYQCIEILIEKILKHKIKIHLEDFDDTTSGFDLKEKISTYSSEKKRINLLINDYSKIENHIKTDITNSIKRFNETFWSNDKIENKTLADLFYLMRNGIIHNYRKYFLSTTFSETEIKELINDLEFLCFEIILTYSEENTINSEN